MKNGSTFEKRQLERKDRHRLRRQKKVRAVRRTEDRWVMGGRTYSGMYPEVAVVERTRTREYHEIQERKAKRAKRRAEQSFKAAEDLIKKGRKGKKKDA